MAEGAPSHAGGLPAPAPGAAPTALRGDLLRFFVLVLVLSLPFWLAGPLAGRLLRGLPTTLPFSALMTFCPLAAAAIMVRMREGGAGVRRLLRRAVDPRTVTRPHRHWYVPVVLVYPVIYLLTYAALRLAGRPLPPVDVPWAALPLVLAAFLVAAVGEEAGWSGYATEVMQQRWSALTTGVLLGAVCALWHVVPLMQAGHAPPWVAWQCAVIFATRPLRVWIYNNTGRSVFPVALFHAIDNLSVSLFPRFAFGGGTHYEPAVAAPLTALAAALVVAVWGPRTLARRGSTTP